MKFSELDKSKLSLDEKYELVMHGIKNYAEKEAEDSEKVDFLIVLGCRPVPLKARVVKAAELYKRGYAKNILFSGGSGWNKNVEKGSQKDIEMIEAIRERVLPELLGEKITGNRVVIEERYNELLDGEGKSLDEKIRNLNESQLMTRMMITLGDVPMENIYHEPFSNNTVENIKYAAILFRNLVRNGSISQVKKIMLVTSSFHCRRATLAFRKYFKGIDITACPSTLDFKDKGINFSKGDMLKNEYYRKQIENELDAIINYTRNGSIEDCEIAEFVGKEIAKDIEGKHYEVDR